MNIPRLGQWGLASLLCALSAYAAADTRTAATDTAAARKERAARADHLDKQKKLFEENRIGSDAPARESAPVVDLPQEEADAPGAVKQ
ncbi:hypothetical protein [Pseudoduganella umbonata]|uniref:DUF4148 domain-containing protein n=1 Tax=Pseudoduganella umbonata TaxID=864828 RepID=A0A4P8HJ35_9BURK|nr:hypothetical protein [Pseudoduganella umbonata]MBB3219516.1 hypothetical protein [Pseudoduganella umbonata]QCP09593.1 hypothetical protein FCL38_03530 [Pseudoduganella umbonata]